MLHGKKVCAPEPYQGGRRAANADQTLTNSSPKDTNSVVIAAAPLPPDRRDAFLIEMAEALSALIEIGDGAVHRTIAVVQRRHFDAPIETQGRHHHVGKYARGG